MTWSTCFFIHQQNKILKYLQCKMLFLSNLYLNVNWNGSSCEETDSLTTLVYPLLQTLYIFYYFPVIGKAGQCRTNLWPTVPDWPWCRNTDAGLTQLNIGENADAGLTFFPAFWHSCIELYTFPQTVVWTWWCFRFQNPQSTVWSWEWIPFHHQLGVNLKVYSFPLSTM